MGRAGERFAWNRCATEPNLADQIAVATGASKGIGLDFVAADLSTPAGPRALVAAAAERGGLGILVNNAGAVVPRFGGIMTVTDDDWADAAAAARS